MAKSIEQAEAESLANPGVTAEDIEIVKRPLPPVGHFGYTEEDADKVREENKQAGATADTADTIGQDVEGPAVDESGRGEGVVRVHDDTATRDGALANVADTGTKRGQQRRATREAAVQQAPAGQSRSGSQPEE